MTVQWKRKGDPMRVQRDSRLLLLLAIVCMSAPSSSTSAAEDDPAPDYQAAKVAEVWQASGILQIPILRLAVSESHIDEATKKKAIESLQSYESELRTMVGEAQKNPVNAGQVLEKVQKLRQEQDPKMKALFTNDQYEQIGKTNSVIALQLTFLTSYPESVATSLEKSVKLTAAQKAMIDPAIAHLADRLKSFKADLEHAADSASRSKRVIEGFDSIESAAIETRSQIRQALSAEQLKEFESSLSYGTATDAQKPGESPATKPAG